LRHVGRYYMTLLNRESVSRAKLCLVFPDIVKDCPKIRKFRECGPWFLLKFLSG